MWQSNAHALITNLGQCPVEYRAQYSKTLHIQPHKGYTYEGMDSVPSIAYRYHGQTWALDAHCRSTKKEKELLYLLNITDVHEIKKLQAAKAACTAAGFKLNLCVFNQTDKTTQIVQNWTYLDEEQVRQYLRRGDLSTVRVLSMDPGVNNYAWSVIEIKRPFEIKILASGMMTHTLTDLVGSTVHQETLLFKQEVNQIMTDYDPQFLIAERYMSRGMGGSTIELVNIMIGILASMWTHSSDRILFIPAAQWKNEFNKVVVDEQRTTLEHMYGKSKVTEHQIDSTCIGLYGAARWLDEKITTWVKKIVTVVPKQIDRVGLR
jgi:Holliday junction resolvasome RuvABC endonuclease subunit